MKTNNIISILGISAYFHDSAAALIIDGIIVAAAQEERFTRLKNDSSFPTNAINYCLKEKEIQLNDIDAIVFYDKPFLKFERIIESHYLNAPFGFFSFLKSTTLWVKEKIFIKRNLRKELKKIDHIDFKKVSLLFSSHHLSHASSSFFSSNYDEAVILTIDAVGEWSTASISIGRGSSITIVKEIYFPDSIGLLYSAFTYYLGFKVNYGEYKLMGLAAYGDGNLQETKDYINTITKNLVDVKSDGSFSMNQKYFDFIGGLRMVKHDKWEKLFGFPKRENSDEIEQHHCNLAYAIQHVLEEIIALLLDEAKRISGLNNLCLAGGVALNCVNNGKVSGSNKFKSIYIPPSPGDGGGAIGAALASYFIYYSRPRIKARRGPDLMNGSYLGPSYSSKEIESMINKYRAKYLKVIDQNELVSKVVEYLEQGKVIGWFQGRMEFGPRALGNRSILADSRRENMQGKINNKIKNRETFRPFAPSVLFEDKSKYFKMDIESEYMLFAFEVAESIKKDVPLEFSLLSMQKKLSLIKSIIPAVTHVDFTSRVHTVMEIKNPLYWKLINEFKKKTGHGVILNTSFNASDEPIVCSPEDAYKCFVKTKLDVLVIENYIFERNQE